MSVNVQVWGPNDALRMLGETGRNCNVVVFSRNGGAEDELYPVIMNWVGDNGLNCVVLPKIQRLEILSLMLLFRAKASMPMEAQRTNDGYMLLKLTFSGHERVGSWEDDAWVKSEFAPAW